MSIQAKLEFDMVTQSFVGRPTIPATKAVHDKRLKADPNYNPVNDLATHAFNILVCGLTVRWKNLIGAFFSDTSTDTTAVVKIIREAVHECTSIGLTVCSLTMDSASGNQAL